MIALSRTASCRGGRARRRASRSSTAARRGRVAAPMLVSITRRYSAKVDVRVLGHAARVVRPAFQDDSLVVGTILKVMAVRLAGLEAGARARLEQFFSCVGHQHHFAFEDIDE